MLASIQNFGNLQLLLLTIWLHVQYDVFDGGIWVFAKLVIWEVGEFCGFLENTLLTYIQQITKPP